MHEDPVNQLNLTVVALVAVVAIVGLVALVMNAAHIGKLSTGVQMVSAQPENLAGAATATACFEDCVAQYTSYSEASVKRWCEQMCS